MQRGLGSSNTSHQWAHDGTATCASKRWVLTFKWLMLLLMYIHQHFELSTVLQWSFCSEMHGLWPIVLAVHCVGLQHSLQQTLSWQRGMTWRSLSCNFSSTICQKSRSNGYCDALAHISCSTCITFDSIHTHTYILFPAHIILLFPPYMYSWTLPPSATSIMHWVLVLLQALLWQVW